MVINPEKPIPDYVITYGMIWNLRERGEFFTRVEKPSTGPVDLKDGQQVYSLSSYRIAPSQPKLAAQPESNRP